MFDPKAPLRLDDVPAYQHAMYLHHLEQMAAYNVTGANARTHARIAANAAAEAARARIAQMRPQADRFEVVATKALPPTKTGKKD